MREYILPFYTFKCPNEHEFDILKSFKDYTIGQKEICPSCSELAGRKITASYFSIDNVERNNYSSSLGVNHFSNKSELNEHLKRNGLVDLGTPENSSSVKSRRSETVV